MSHYPNALTAYQNEDWMQAFACLQRGAAAGEADCYNLLAVCYEYGQGTVQNCHQAVRWYRRAIRAGDSSPSAIWQIYWTSPAKHGGRNTGTAKP